MSDEILGQRRKALEDSFFALRDRELMEKLKEEIKKEELAGTCGINDPEVLDALRKADISSETIAALSLIPVIAVAWADGTLSPQERDAIFSATATAGIKADSVCRQLLDSWLSEAPGPELVDAWKGYIRSLAETTSSAAMETLRDNVLSHAHKIATAAGGILGVGSISHKEQAVIDDLGSAFPS